MSDKIAKLLLSLKNRIEQMEGQFEMYDAGSHPVKEEWMKEYNAYVLTYENVLKFRKLKEEAKSS